MRSAFVALVVSLALLTTSFDVDARGGKGGSRPYYGGGKHTQSHGGQYPGGSGKSHKGGSYKNPRTGDQYGKH